MQKCGSTTVGILSWDIVRCLFWLRLILTNRSSTQTDMRITKWMFEQVVAAPLGIKKCRDRNNVWLHSDSWNLHKIIQWVLSHVVVISTINSSILRNSRCCLKMNTMAKRWPFRHKWACPVNYLHNQWDTSFQVSRLKMWQYFVLCRGFLSYFNLNASSVFWITSTKDMSDNYKTTRNSLWGHILITV